MTTGQIIKQLREQHKMTQEQLAEALGYSHKSSINKIEMGKADLTQSKLIEIARVFNVSPCYLLGMDDQMEEWNEQYNQNSELSQEVKLIEEIQSHFGKQAVHCLHLFLSLNQTGKEKVIETINDLLEIPKYQKGE